MSDRDSIGAEIILLEKRALEQWNHGDPDGFIALSSDGVVYEDPALEHALVGREALEAYYDPIRGKGEIIDFKMIDPVVRASSITAVLIYGYEARRDGSLFRMRCTEVYRATLTGQWEIIRTRWSCFRSVY